ncbi:MAG: glycosyltransferase family 4 protein [Chloroflexi bacterium]|nr:glycosyltransferase family 4 protein [Chloroflexota bacterium]
MKKLQILVISNYYPPFELGGWGQLTHDVSVRLRERGHLVHVLTSNYKSAEKTPAEPFISRTLHLESLDHANYHLQYIISQRRHEAENRRVVSQTIAKFTPDIVYVNGMWNMSADVAKTAEQLCPGRVVYYMASYWPAETDAHTAYWQLEPAHSWLRLPKKMAGVVVRRLLLSTMPRNQLDFRLVLCVSAFLRDQIAERAGIPHSQMQVVHNGIDLDAFPMRSLTGAPSGLRLLYAGRLSPDKGVHTVIEGLAHLLKKHPDAPVQLSIIGAGVPTYESRLQMLVVEFNLERWVTFRPFVPREQMPAVLAEHDILLFPSIWAEPLARMVQEAMAMGLGVIGTPTGGTPEILHDGETGLVFEAENALMLAEKMAALLNNDDWRVQLSRAARQTVEERFTLSRMVDELEAYFNWAISEPFARREAVFS